MNVEIDTAVSISEAKQNFSGVTKIAEECGQAIILKNNRPKFLLIDVDSSPQIEMSDDEKIDFVAECILREHRAAFEELAK